MIGHMNCHEIIDHHRSVLRCLGLSDVNMMYPVNYSKWVSKVDVRLRIQYDPMVDFNQKLLETVEECPKKSVLGDSPGSCESTSRCESTFP